MVCGRLSDPGRSLREMTEVRYMMLGRSFREMIEVYQVMLAGMVGAGNVL